MQIKKRLNKRGRKEKIQAYLQIINLIFGIIAIAFIIGIFNTGFVSGTTDVPDEEPDFLKGLPGLEGAEALFDAPATLTTPGGTTSDLPATGRWSPRGEGTTPDVTPDGTEWGNLWSKSALKSIFTSAMYGYTAYLLGPMIAPLLGFDDEAEIEAASYAAGWGVFTGKLSYDLFGKGILSETLSKWQAAGIGLAVAVIVYHIMYEDTKTETVTFTCGAWDAPTGGEYCEECNKQGELPCSEYQCRSLGQSCQLLNPGTDEEKCAWINRNDVKYPIIEPWVDALLDDYTYKPDNTISPPDRGVIVWNDESTTGCAKAFTPLSFGVVLDEPAKCKIDFLRKNTFDDMDYYFGGSSLLRYNHTQVMSLPGPGAFDSENLTIQNDGDYELYVRCQDANGNHNTANFVFKYCIEKGPDTTPPLIVTTSLLNNMPIAYEQSSVDLEVYVNEPADCRWSHLDQDYDNMEESMVCSSNVFEMNAQMLYTCKTELTGLKDRVENKFYFRCKDNAENVNRESYEFVLIGTQPLIIDWVKPNGTVKDSTESVKVTLEAKTSAGYKEGEATCYHSDTGEDDDYVMFFNTNSYQHSQDLRLVEGDYEYFIKCCDLGNNCDTKTVNFNVESDSESPIVVRAYHEETYLKLITNEEAECVYDTSNCNYPFDDGISLTVVDETSHFTDWNTNIDFYIKCRDEYGNEPTPQDVCSIIIRPFEVYE